MKKTISLLLCLLLAVGSLPFSALADTADNVNFPSGLKAPTTYIDFNNKTAENRIGGGQNGEIVSDASFIRSADGSMALHLENAFGKNAKQYLKLPGATLGDSDFTVSLMYRASGEGGFTEWAGKWTSNAEEKKFKGFESVEVKAGGAVFSTADTSITPNRGVSLLNLPSCTDGTLLLSDGTSEVNKNAISNIQDTDWHSLVLSVKRGSTAQLYLDGEVYASVGVSGISGSLDGNGTLNFGADGLGNYGVGSGDFDNIAVFSYALSDAEVASYTARDLYAKEIETAKGALSKARIGSRYSAKMIREFSKTVTDAESQLGDTATDLVAARTALKAAIDAFQAGREPLKKVAVASDTHIYATSREEALNNATNKQAIAYLKKARELGCETLLNAGDYAETRDDDNEQFYFDFVNEFFLSAGGKNSAVCIGNHQYTHSYTGLSDETNPVDSSYFMKRCSQYIDPNAQPNRSIVDENGILKTTYYYVTDGVANYLTVNPFENSTTKLSILISDEQWRWVFDTLDYCKTTGKPTFIVGHLNYKNLQSRYSAQFKRIMQNYKGVSYISGDDHNGIGYCGLTVYNDGSNAENQLFTIDTPTTLGNRNWYGGLDAAAFFVNIYEDCYVIRYYDIAKDEFLPYFDTTVYFEEFDDFSGDNTEAPVTPTEITGLESATAQKYAYDLALTNSGFSQEKYDEIYNNHSKVEVNYYAADPEYTKNEQTGKYEAEALSQCTFVERNAAKYSDGIIPNAQEGDSTAYISGSYKGNLSLKAAIDAGGTKLGDGPLGVLYADLKSVRSIDSILIGSAHASNQSFHLRKYDVYISNSLTDLFNESNKVLSYSQPSAYVNKTDKNWYYNKTTKEYANTASEGFDWTRFGDSQFIEFKENEQPIGRYVALVANDAGSNDYPRADIGEFSVFSESDNRYCDVLFKDLKNNRLEKLLVPKGRTLNEFLSASQISALNAAIPNAEGYSIGRTVGSETFYWNHSFDETITKPIAFVPLYSCAHTKTKNQGEIKATCVSGGNTGNTVCADCDELLLSGTETPINPENHVGKTSVVGAKAATCTAVGYTGDTVCDYCKAVLKKGTAIALKAHTLKTTVTKATTAKDGKITKACTACKKTISTTTIYKASKVTLSTTKYTYNGKVKTPTVTVKTSKGKTLKKNTDYTVSYASGRKYVGKYAVKITFKGNYWGTKTLYFTINPKGTSLKSVKAGKKSFTAKWSAQKSQTSGYQVQYSTSKSFKGAKTATITKNKTTSKTVKSLKASKKYYVRVRTYKTEGKTKYYSGWSGYKTVKTKK